jgi:hypothetical protein
MPEPLKIAYLVEDTEMSGGVRVQLAHADALIDRGHRVRLVTKGLPLTWRPSRAEWIYVDDFRQYDASDDDFIVATFWLTVGPAHEIAPGRAVHLCQGYEDPSPPTSRSGRRSRPRTGCRCRNWWSRNRSSRSANSSRTT